MGADSSFQRLTSYFFPFRKLVYHSQIGTAIGPTKQVGQECRAEAQEQERREL
jgi:hypothetical protein